MSESDDDCGDGDTDYPADAVSWPGCACEHDPDSHTWAGCTFEGCNCDVSWEE